ncbi:MAG: hypothetical protein QXT81_00485 [Candidatus Bathyarchaeia archaeon]
MDFLRMSPTRTRPKVRTKSRHGRRALEISFLILMIGLVAFAVQDWFIQPRPREPMPSKAALIDQLAISFPNSSFVSEFKKIFGSAGFTTDVYSGAEVNIDLYRNLPSKGYGAIVFRVHQSTPVEYLLPNPRPVAGPPVYLFTGEPYVEQKYVIEQLSDLVVPAREINGSKIYFAIGPKFVQSMSGKFPNTVVVLAGCSGLYSAELADSLIVKGASIVIGWQRFVQMDYTDAAVIRLLKALVLERTTVNRAIAVTIADVGLDPSYRTNLLAYPEQRIGLTFQEALQLEEELILSQDLGFLRTAWSLSSARRLGVRR